MRRTRNYVGDFKSSFLSCEKDTELIIKKLFVNSKPYSDELKRLLIINNKDCLDDRMNPEYLKKIKETSIADLIEQGYVRINPLLKQFEHENLKTYLLISFDNFDPSNNIHYRDCNVMIDIICHTSCWDLGNYRQRPLKICGYIDGILNDTKLTGIGTFNFISCREIVLSEEYAGYCLMYRAVHGDDDSIELEDNI